MRKKSIWLFILLLVFCFFLVACQKDLAVISHDAEALAQYKQELQDKEDAYALAMRQYYMGQVSEKELWNIVAEIETLHDNIAKEENYWQNSQ